MKNPKMANCKRCGQPFQPQPTKLKTIKYTRCCDTCKVRNLFDGLDMPTPPEFLDKYTKHPTLSEREFKIELNKVEG